MYISVLIFSFLSIAFLNYSSLSFIHSSRNSTLCFTCLKWKSVTLTRRRKCTSLIVIFFSFSLPRGRETLRKRYFFSLSNTTRGKNRWRHGEKHKKIVETRREKIPLQLSETTMFMLEYVQIPRAASCAFLQIHFGSVGGLMLSCLCVLFFVHFFILFFVCLF